MICFKGMHQSHYSHCTALAIVFDTQCKSAAAAHCLPSMESRTVNDGSETLSEIMNRFSQPDTDEATLLEDAKSFLTLKSDEIHSQVDGVISRAWDKYTTESDIQAWITHVRLSTWPTLGYRADERPCVEALERALQEAPESRPRVRSAFEATTDLSNEGEGYLRDAIVRSLGKPPPSNPPLPADVNSDQAGRHTASTSMFKE